MLSRQLMDYLCGLLDRERACNPLLELAERGALAREQMAEYLYNTAYIALNTQIHVELGFFKADAENQKELAEFFREKKREEAGHAQWAFQDLARLQGERGGKARFRVAEPLIELLELVQRELDANPASYLIYSLFMESLNTRLGPIFLRALTEKCPLSEEELSMLVHHVELDSGHVEEDCRAIDLMSAQGANLKLDDACRFLDALTERFMRFTCSIAEESRRDVAPAC